MTQGCCEMLVMNQMNEISDISRLTHLLLPISPYTPDILIRWRESTCEFKVAATSKEVHTYNRIVPTRSRTSSSRNCGRYLWLYEDQRNLSGVLEVSSEGPTFDGHWSLVT